MFENNFDPYDLLITLNDRLNRLEHVHNRLATAHYKAEADLKVAQHTILNLQQRFLELQAIVYSQGEQNVQSVQGTNSQI